MLGKFKTLGLICGLTVVSQAHAIDGYLGFGLGVSDISLQSGIDGENFDLSLGLSFEGGVEVSPGLEIGAELQYYGKSIAGGLGQVTITPFLVNLRYHFFESLIDGPYLGASVGFVNESVEILGQDASDFEMTAGAQAGYLFQVSEAIGIGPKFTYLRIFGSPQAYNYWSALASLNYMF